MTDPAKLAAKLLADHAPGKFPVPVEDIAKALKVEVLTSRHDGPESSFALRDEAKLYVGININTSKRRQRVATAHALGHLLMHERPIIVCNAVRLARPGIPSRGSGEEEAEANAFATALLLPPEAVAAVFAARDDKQTEALFPRDKVVDELAKQFDVGGEFMCYRLVSLGLLAS